MDLSKVWPLLLAAGVEWRPGILNGNDGTRYMGGGRWAWDDPLRHHAQGIDDNDIPDITDPATKGCLLAELRRVSGDNFAKAKGHPRDDGNEAWAVVWFDGDKFTLYPYAPTEGEALIRALCAVLEVPND